MSKHTDSVEARFNAKFNTHPYDKAQHIEYKAKEIIRFIKSEIKKSNSQQVEEAVRKMFNLNELEKEWQEQFYESEWHPDTLKKTQLEKDIEKELGTFLPRHMDVYDWNLPYIDFITLVVRKHIKKALTPNQQD